MNDTSRQVAVVGAGLAGLGAAWELMRRGFSVVVLEREQRPGGRLRGENVEGFTLEAVSPLLSTADEALLAWIGEVGRGDDLLPLRPVMTLQAHRDRIAEIDPRGLLGIARIPGVRLHHALRLVRLPRLMARYADRIVPGRPERAADLDDRSLADFGRLYFGRSVVDHWMAPLVTAGSLGDEHQTSRVHFLQRYRSHAGARVGLPRAPLAEVTEAAAAKLRILIGAEVTRVDAAPSGAVAVHFNDGRARAFEAGAAIVATSAPDAVALSEGGLEAAERDVLLRVRYTPSVVLAAALRRPFASHAQEVRVPHAEDSPLETVLLEPGLPGGRVPDGRGLATLRATGAWSERALRAPDEVVEKELLAAFDRLSPGVRQAILFTRLLRVSRALPRFDVGHYRDLSRLDAVQTEMRAAGRRLYLAGDYLMDPSPAGALRSGFRAARRVARDLGAAAAAS